MDVSLFIFYIGGRSDAFQQVFRIPMEVIGAMDILSPFPDGLLDVFGQGAEKLIGILILLKKLV